METFSPLVIGLAALTISTALTSANAESQPTPDQTPPPTEQPPQPYVAEANLPVGFPMPGPADAVTLKTYPAYRVAHATGPNAFWKLFGHIQRENIPMTAPVTMASPTADDQGQATDQTHTQTNVDFDRSQITMGFLYQSTDVGDLGTDDADASVQVQDIQPMTVLSYGFFGDPTDPKLQHAQAQIKQTLEQQHPDHAFAGPFRLLGYNGPSVPREKRFHELQRPVQPASTPNPDENPQANPDTNQAPPQ